MEMKRRSFVYGMAATSAAILAGCTSKAKIDEAVVKDLQAGYNGECNAAAKYAMYAKEAKKAGYLGVATFFEAAAFAESIHGNNHAKVLKKFGIEAKTTIKLPQWVDVTTALKDAIKGETYEFTEMYPGFIKTAMSKRAALAVRSFTNAMKAEKVHAAYYTDALNNLEAWKAAGKKFYICEVCGFTTADEKATALCPYCGAPKAKFRTFG